MTALVNVVKPPVIRGNPPAGYSGPLYYRLSKLSFEPAKKPLHQLIIFANQKIAQRLATLRPYNAAMRNAPELCDANGELLSDLRMPLAAKLKAGAKRWDEFSMGMIPLVSERIAATIEAAAPDAHYLVPVDVTGPDGQRFRVYAFYCGVGRRRTLLHLEANNIPHSRTDTGDFDLLRPEWLDTDRFGYLDAKVVAGAPLLYDHLFGLVFSQSLTEQLGDCMAAGWAFVPMGFVA